MKKNVLDSGNIRKLLLKLSVPATIGMLVTALYNIVDMIFVGKGVGALAIGAVSITMPIFMFILAIALLLGTGGASYISRSLGANKRDLANKALGNVIVITIFFGLIMAFMGILFLEKLLIFFGATEAILPFAREYSKIILFGSVFSCFSITCNNLVRSEGKAKVAMISLLLGAVLNVVLDPLFIFVLDMGIRGAAVATIISNIVSSLYLIRFYFSDCSVLVFKLKNLKLKFGVIKEILLVGSSSFARQIGGVFMYVLLNRALGFYGGDLAISSLGIINRLTMFIFMPIFGITQGYQPIAGYNFGAKRFDLTNKVTKIACIWATGVSILGFIILFFGAKLLVKMFTNDDLLIEQATTYLKIIVLALPVVGFQVIGATLFQAIGKALPAFLLAVSRQILILFPLIYILPKTMGVVGIWYAFPLSDIIAFILTGLMVWGQTKKFRYIYNK